MLTSRKQDILRAIVQEYIMSANPVGSRTIAKRGGLKLSPATIRNEMSDLEDDGYLTHPHTSAGRVPTVNGYRFFVDYLMKMKRLTEEERLSLKHALDEVKHQRRHVRDLLKLANHLLAEMSKYTSLILAPHFDASRLKNIQLISVDSCHVLVVLVTEAGLVEDHVITVDYQINQDDLNEISNILKAKVAGMSISEISKVAEEEFTEEFSRIKRYDNLLTESLKVLRKSLALAVPDSVEIDGLINILHQPEFKDIDNIRPIMEFLEKKKVLWHILEEGLDYTDVRVLIGSEGKRNPGVLTVITAPYRMRGNPVGTVALVGPTRMQYGRAMAVVKEMADALGSVLSEYEEV